MPLAKDTIQVPFVSGLDTKTNPWLVQPPKLLELENGIFQKGGLIKKRNGFSELTSLPSTADATTLTTFRDNLTAIGSRLYAYSQESEQWVDKGYIKSLQLSVQTAVRGPYSQTAQDSAVTAEGLACIVYLDGDAVYKYQITDNLTGQVLVSATTITTGALLARVFHVGTYFVITFLKDVSGTPKLQYIAISVTNITSVIAATDISANVSSTSAGYNGTVSNNTLYLAWDGSDGGGAFRATYLSSTLAQGSTVALTGHTASLMSVSSDTSGSTSVIWITGWAGNNAYTVALSQALNTILSFTKTIDTEVVVKLTSTAINGVCTIFYEVSNTYSYNSVRTDILKSVTCTVAGVVGTPAVVLRGVGLTSKAFLVDSISYMMVAYGETFQPTYFLINSSGYIIAKLAYSNGGGYTSTQVLANVSLNDSQASISYLIKDLLIPVNKTQGSTVVAGAYSQTGVNICTFDFSSMNLISAEIGGNLNIAGGILWGYDGVKPVESGFHVWPENVVVTTSTSGGSIADQTYFYAVTYEWTDGQGNIHRSAPSVPTTIVTAGGNTSTNTIKIPTLRLTYKVTPNAVRIVIYRWSTAQQVYYQLTSVSAPTLNVTNADSVTYTDTVADASILGNNILYTTGGIVENIGPPACSSVALYGSRLILIDAEDPNLLWYSKQVIESTPVEMSDLFTFYVAPTTGSRSSTGITKAISALDDKLIIFKAGASYYITGTGPDNTGANNDFSQPVFIMGTVGCDMQQSIGFLPDGLLFDSQGSRWRLKRDLSTDYLGAPVEAYNNSACVSAVNISGQNQLRLALDDGRVLMYDYYYGQWGTFPGIPQISSCLYQGKHTFLDQYGRVFQELEDSYVDGSVPVLMRLSTGWIPLSGIQSLERAYYFYLLAQYFSPHKLNVSIAYDYNDSPSQSSIITPDNFAPAYGAMDADGVYNYYGQGQAYGGPGDVEQWRIFLRKQKCQAFRITIQEAYDPSFNILPGAGFNITGLDLVIGKKKGYPTLKAARSVG